MSSQQGIELQTAILLLGSSSHKGASIKIDLSARVITEVSLPKQALTSELHIIQRGAHTEEELTAVTTLSTISRLDTMIIDPQGQTPSHAKEGNLETVPTTTISLSPLLGGTFMAPIRDLSSAVQTGEDGRKLDYDTRVESRLDLIAGTNTGLPEGLSDTPTERLSVNLFTQPLNLSEMSVLRKTPVEPDSEQTTIPISTPHTTHTTQVTERISSLKSEVSCMKTKIVYVKKAVVEMKQVQHGQQQDNANSKAILAQVLARLPHVQSTQSTSALKIEDNRTKREKEGQEKGTGAVDKGKGKVGEEADGSHPQGEYRHPDLKEGIIYQPYIHEYVDDIHFDENVNDVAYQLSRNEIISQIHALKEDDRIDVFESFAKRQQVYKKYNFEQVNNRRRILPLPKTGKEWDMERERLSRPELGLKQNDKKIGCYFVGKI